MEKAPAGITGSFSMLFLMVLGRFPEKFGFGIFFPLQHDYRSNTSLLYMQLLEGLVSQGCGLKLLKLLMAVPLKRM